MGRSCLFECPKCGYKAKVSGGADRGVHFHVQTILCRECRALYDAVVRLKVNEPPRPKSLLGQRRRLLSRPAPKAPPAFEAALNRLPPQNKRSVWVPFKIQCPVSTAHPVRPWQEPDRCPKCGTFLEKSALPYRIWQ